MRNLMGHRMADDPPSYYAAHLFVCRNRRPEKVRDYMKARAKKRGVPQVRVNAAGCLDRCEHGPCLVIYPEDVWYRLGTTADVDAILARRVAKGGRVPGLMLRPETS